MSTADDAFRSALERLGVAILICEGERTVRPSNKAGALVFERESLTQDLLRSRPSHPLSELVRRVQSGDISSSSIVKFPSGSRYSVEPSRRSDKGRDRWLLLLIRPIAAERRSDVEAALQTLDLTEKEREVARLLAAGESSAEIQKSLGISANTLKTHLARLFENSGTSSRAQFVARLLGGE